VLYSAHEAYDVIGRRLFDHEWVERFAGMSPVPDMALVRILADRGAELPDEAKEFLEADPEEAEARQAQRRREDQVFNDLVDTIRWGKAAAWYRLPDWRLISPFDLQEGCEALARLRGRLKEDVVAVLKDGKPDPKQLLIDRDGLDKWVGWLNPIDQRSPLVPPKPRPAHRPPFDWGAFDREFDRRSEQGLLGPIRRGSLINLARDLEAWFKNARPDAVRLSQAPNAKTIAKHLRPTFREYEKK